MITEQDLRAAIAECEGERNPNASTCIKLAAFYTIYDHMYGEKPPEVILPQLQSFSTDPKSDTIPYGNSEFAEIAQEKGLSASWPVIEELVGTISVIVPRLYDSFMRKMQDL